MRYVMLCVLVVLSACRGGGGGGGYLEPGLVDACVESELHMRACFGAVRPDGWEETIRANCTERLEVIVQPLIVRDYYVCVLEAPCDALYEGEDVACETEYEAAQDDLPW